MFTSFSARLFLPVAGFLCLLSLLLQPQMPALGQPYALAFSGMWVLTFIVFNVASFKGRACWQVPTEGKCLLFLLALFLLWVFAGAVVRQMAAWDVAIAVVAIGAFVGVVAWLVGDDGERFADFMLCMAGLAVALALLSMVVQFGVNERVFAYRGWRMQSLGLDVRGGWGHLGNPIDAGLYYGVFACVLLERLTRFGQRYWVTIFCGLGLLVLTAYLLLTFSRGPLVALLVAVVALALWRGNRRSWLLVAVIPFVLLVLWLGFEAIWQAEVQRGTTGRVQIWWQAWDNIQAAVLLGHGFPNGLQYAPNRYAKYDFEHNWFLGVWVRYGLVGLLLILSATAVALWSSFRLRMHQRVGHVAVLGAVLLVFGIVGMQSYVDNLIRLPHVYWLLLWLPLAVIAGAGFSKGK